jgi:hypothetical protein
MDLITGSDILGRALRMRGEWAELARVAREMVALIETANQLQVLEQRASAWIAESRARLGEPTESVGEATAVLARALDPVALESCVRALLFAGGAEQREAIESAFERMAGIIEWTGSRVFSPFLHELRAQLALVCGDADTCESERREAERLWTEMGAHGHIERMAQELVELRAAK